MKSFKGSLTPTQQRIFSLVATQQLGERLVNVQGAGKKVVYQQLLNNRNNSKGKKMDGHFSVETNTTLYQT